MIPDLEVRYGRTDRFDHSHSFVAEHRAGQAGRHIALEDVQVRATDGGVQNLHHRVAGVDNVWFRDVLDGFLVGAAVYKCLHGLALL